VEQARSLSPYHWQGDGRRGELSHKSLPQDSGCWSCTDHDRASVVVSEIRKGSIGIGCRAVWLCPARGPSQAGRPLGRCWPDTAVGLAQRRTLMTQKQLAVTIDETVGVDHGPARTQNNKQTLARVIQDASKKPKDQPAYSALLARDPSPDSDSRTGLFS